MTTIHFLCSNGLHHSAYNLLFASLIPHDISTVQYPPLATPTPDIPKALTWHYFLDSISNNLDESTRIGMGHSLGGTLLLYHAIQHPGSWDTIFIVEPALFSPSVIWLYRLIRLLYLEDYLHPMIRLTKKRRDTFDSRTLVFERWRKRALFQYMSDDALRFFIDASLVYQDDAWALRFSKQWEMAIYRSMCSLDAAIWKGLPTLTSKLVVVAGETSNTFLHGAQDKIKPFSHEFLSIKDTSHLLPFEAPVALADIVHYHMQ